MKRFVSKRSLVILLLCLFLIGVMVPVASFAKSSSGEPHHPAQPPKVTMRTNPATGKSDPSVTIQQACPATTPINPTPFNAGDVVSGTAAFTSTDPNEGTETEEANNTLAVFITIPPVFVKLNQTTPFTFSAKAGDNLFACFAIYDGDEVGTINYTVTTSPQPDFSLSITCNDSAKLTGADKGLERECSLSNDVTVPDKVVGCAGDLGGIILGKLLLALHAKKIANLLEKVGKFKSAFDLATAKSVVEAKLAILGFFGVPTECITGIAQLLLQEHYEPVLLCTLGQFGPSDFSSCNALYDDILRTLGNK